jgi:DNA topoisomerase-1
MKQLIHNGIYIPEEPAAVGLAIKIRNERVPLTPEQENMAISWAKKIGTYYAKDRRFVKNFFRDFQRALGLKEKIPPEAFDFFEVVQHLARLKAQRDSMSTAEKQLEAEKRKKKREELLNTYGHVTVDGKIMEIENYVAEPSGIFLGCAKHPLRGRWKLRPTEQDVILNLSPDASRPPGNWGEIVWESDSTWVAKWRDKLSGKIKYVWLAASTPIKQVGDVEKFEKAKELASKIEAVRGEIARRLTDSDVRVRKLATVVYIIDSMNMRVGDEKDRDEAETVGTTTLKRENVKIKENGVVLFDFYGKGAVKWHREKSVAPAVAENLAVFLNEPNEEIFTGISSKAVNKFLGEIMPGLTAKVFRTFHATESAGQVLERTKVTKNDPDFLRKHVLVLANLSAAKICNHKKIPSKNWKEQLEKKKKRLAKLRQRNTRKSREAARRLALKISEMQLIRDYNLRTSLKSYIDPRVLFDWCKKVEYDWKEYYPTTLQKRFSWAEKNNSE